MLPRSCILLDIPSISVIGPVASGPISNTYQGTLGGVKVRVEQARSYSTPSNEDMWLQTVRCPLFSSNFPALIGPEGLPGSYFVEVFETSEHRPFHRCHHYPSATGFKMDAGWEYNGVSENPLEH